ncbi:MAG: dipeptidase PepE [Bacteroidetes bacterium]|nr:dipeptidase PepE [Bacteroidota bacterium]
MKLLAFSSSRVGNGGYLEAAAPVIHEFLGDQPLRIAFVPFASADGNYEAYTQMVRTGLKELPYHINTVQNANDHTTVSGADVIVVGGGNTFKLLHDLYAGNLLQLIKEKVQQGTPYIGWSAGSNITGATICTTNDMPIINPGSFDALQFLPFQINPHYYNQPVSGFNGETRDQRLTEFLTLNPSKKIVGLPEGTVLHFDQGKLSLFGKANGVLFTRQNNEVIKSAIHHGDDISYLLQ